MKDQIKDFIIKTFMSGNGPLKDDEQLFDSGIMDSLGLLKLLTFIEETFEARIDMSQLTMEKFGTVNDIVATINENMNK